MVTTVRHLYESPIWVVRESDGTWFHFQTYRLSGSEWGYELVRAEGHSCSTISDPNWPSERAVIEAIHEHVDDLEHVPGYGWCVITRDEKAAVGIRR